jgi:hypothetical protein
MFERTLALAGMLILASAAPAFAQIKLEGTVLAGWSFSEGVSGRATTITGLGTFDRLEPKDGEVFGLGYGAVYENHTEFGFLWTRQSSKLVVGGSSFTGTSDREIGNMSLNNYHGYFGYNFGEQNASFRPFLYGGLGATHFGSVDFSTPVRSGTIGGNTQFSTTWGAGVKLFPHRRFGFRASASWTPTYVKSDAEGWWCDPFWGCYVFEEPQYSNQIHVTGGLIFRF